MSNVLDQVMQINQRMKALIDLSQKEDAWLDVAKQYGVLQASLYDLDLQSAADDPQLGPCLSELQSSNAALLNVVARARHAVINDSKALKSAQKASNAYQKGY